MHGGARGTNGVSCGKEEKDFWEVQQIILDCANCILQINN